jgi:diguanylate cyclase
MSVLSKQNNPDKWKKKYFDLLEENEQLQISHQNEENLLCKTIARLSLATTGFNKELDPYLVRIRKQLKNGLKSEQLKSELEKFSSALMILEENDPEQSRTDELLLFEFLFNHFPDLKNNFLKLKVKYENKGFPNSQYLFVAINDLIDSNPQVEPLNGSASKSIQNDVIDAKAINALLHQLLDDTEIPDKFEALAEKIKQDLHCNAPLATVLDQTVSLFIQIKKHFQSEKQEITEFFNQLTEQLTELGIKASGTHSSSKSTTNKRNLLDQSVSSQMIDLQQSSKNATKLEPLKQLIQYRLADITKQIQNHQTQENIERNKIHQELDSLTIKFNGMKQESHQLKNKLIAAQQKATHDPLTGLPNRLAYDQRLTTEMARWKRYQTPLTLIIWDIDFFKKINDIFGHKAGDKTLRLIAKIILHHCRETDFVSRFGGEEFTMLLSDTNAQAALQAAENIRLVIENTAFNSSGKKIAITTSCGITQFTDNDTADSAFNRADKALYDAKNNGRNQCVIR